MLANPISFQGFEPIARRRPQIAKGYGRVQIIQFTSRHYEKVGGEALDSFAVKSRPRHGIFEALDYGRDCIMFRYISLQSCIEKRYKLQVGC
jgi:hypothetical protein